MVAVLEDLSAASTASMEQALDSLRALVERIYGLDVQTFSDEDFQELESIIDTVAQIVGAIAGPTARSLAAKLAAAREGVERGVSPNPLNRPSRESVIASLNEDFGRLGY